MQNNMKFSRHLGPDVQNQMFGQKMSRIRAQIYQFVELLMKLVVNETLTEQIQPQHFWRKLRLDQNETPVFQRFKVADMFF